MVVGAFPVFKLGALLLKQISKPIANVVKEQAKRSPVFRTYVCMPPAQFYNWWEVKAKMWILNLGKPVNIPVLNEAMAIELGANLLGEGIIFIIAAGLLLSEYNRGVRKEAAKEKARQDEVDAMNNSLKELFFQAEQNSAQIRELMRMVIDLENRVVQKPWVGKKDPKDTKNPPTTPPQIYPVVMPVPPTAETPKKTFDLPDKRDNFETSTFLESIKYAESMLCGQEQTIKHRGILTAALDYIYKDVYRVSMS